MNSNLLLALSVLMIGIILFSINYTAIQSFYTYSVPLNNLKITRSEPPLKSFQVIQDNRVLLGCLGERVSKCYPTDPQEYRNALYKYYFGSDEDLPSYSAFDFDRLHITNSCNDKPMICYGEFANGTKTRVSCDFMFYGCRNTIELHDYKTDDK